MSTICFVVSVRREVAIAAVLRRGWSWLPAIRRRSSLVEDEASCDGKVSSSGGRRRFFFRIEHGIGEGANHDRERVAGLF
jgi:hypothetical protein